MAGLKRVTDPTLDVAEYFLANLGERVHGWKIMQATNRSGPTVYNVLDRFEDAGWVTAEWEDLPEDSKRPRRRYYTLTPNGTAEVRQLLAERRPARAAALRLLPGLSTMIMILCGAR